MEAHVCVTMVFLVHDRGLTIGPVRVPEGDLTPGAAPALAAVPVRIQRALEAALVRAAAPALAHDPAPGIEPVL